MKKFDLSVLTISVCILGLGFLGLNQGHSATPVAVATVNGEAITKSAHYDAMKEQGGEAALDRLVVETLIKQEAAKKGISANDEDLNKALDTMKKQVGSDEQFQAFLQQANLTEDKLKDKLVFNVLLDKMFEKEITPTDADIKKFYDENKETLGNPVPTLDQAKEKVTQILMDMKRSEKIPAWLEEAKKNAKIEKLGVAATAQAGEGEAKH
ncbi:SurA N-terminal domain-containing protein [Brevibacillus dissolubilis]|uniref:SurA N-terminal domain-containing protein n=1 Tax=Brevibacillus dissolubilis TaxID=1844116 RepID=UPI001115D60F|nr:SurA N-terminal domain-containing protein [Brevibacillus dissolubilis]